MTLHYAWSAALASAAVLALFLTAAGLRGRLFLDALAIGATLGSTVALVLAPFALKANPYHFSPATLAFGFAGAPEEGIKLLGIAAFLRGHFRARDRRDVALAAGALALGFGGLENLFYLAQAGTDWAALALERALTAQPFHVMLGLAGGYAVARAPRGVAGGAWGLAIWAGLAATHGLYDYGVFAAADPPPAFRQSASALGLDPGQTIGALTIAAEAAAATAAALALKAAGRSAPAGRAARWLGWGLAAALGGGALVGAIYGAVAGYALDSVGAFGDVVAFAVLPFAVGALSAPAWRPLSRRGRRVAAGAALAALVLAAVAAGVWGPMAWRKLDAARQQSLGARYAAAGDFAEAEQALNRAVAEAPGDAEPLAQRAAAYASARRYEAALADIDAALRLSPTAALYAQRADVDRRRNAPEAALADLNAALALAPDDPALPPLRAQAELETGDSKGAYDDLAEASRRTPGAPLVRMILADWDVNAGDLDGALRELNARLHDAPDDMEATFRRGRVWLYKGEFARADADLARAAGSDLYPALWRFLAQTRLHAAAGPDLRKSLESASGWPAPVARMLLGDIDPAAARRQAGDEGERCEADFYFAASRLGLDASETSAERLRAAMAECPTSFVEYEGAKEMLRRLAL
jgi:predicted Zn-dependent protease